MSHQPTTNPARWKPNWSEVFGCDPRSLAVFRIALGLLILADLATRLPDLAVFYTDDGFFTRQLCRELVPAGCWSLYLINGDLWFQTLLFAVAAVFAVLLILGSWTRVATVVSWIFLVSLHIRSPLLLNAGDVLFRMLLFWSMFLPLGRTWSIDALRGARRSSDQPSMVVSGASVAIIVQLCLMYWFTGIAKWNEIWFGGQALEYVLRLDLFIKPLGRSLLDLPWLLKFVSVSTVLVEVFAPFLLFVPWKTRHIRLGMILLFMSFHLGILFSISIGLFSTISMAGWLPLIPQSFWQSSWVAWVGRVFQWPPMKPIGSGLYGLAAFVFRLPRNPSAAVKDPTANVINHKSRQRSWAQFVFVDLGCGFLLLFAVVWNFQNLGQRPFMPLWMLRLGHTTMIAQEFEMFGRPPTFNNWFVYRARLRNGEEVDLVNTDRPVSMERPDDVMNTLPSHRWRKLHRNLLEKEHRVFCKPLAEYFCRRWNRQHDEDHQVVVMDLICFYEKIGPDYQRGDFVQESFAHLELGDKKESSIFSNVLESLKRGGDIFP